MFVPEINFLHSANNPSCDMKPTQLFKTLIIATVIFCNFSLVQAQKIGLQLYSLRNQFPLQRFRLWQRLQRQRCRVKRFRWFWQFGWRGGVRWRGSGRICGGHRRRRTNEFPTISGCRAGARQSSDSHQNQQQWNSDYGAREPDHPHRP